MSQISGVGGAFVFSTDPKSLAEWYVGKLGLAFEGGPDFFYQVFFGLDPDDPSRKLDTTFSILKAKQPFPRPGPYATEPESMYGDQPFMVNLRVRDMDALLAGLEAGGVEIIKREDEDYGRFAWIRDPDGNRVELYQPLSA